MSLTVHSVIKCGYNSVSAFWEHLIYVKVVFWVGVIDWQIPSIVVRNSPFNLLKHYILPVSWPSISLTIVPSILSTLKQKNGASFYKQCVCKNHRHCKLYVVRPYVAATGGVAELTASKAVSRTGKYLSLVLMGNVRIDNIFQRKRRRKSLFNLTMPYNYYTQCVTHALLTTECF